MGLEGIDYEYGVLNGVYGAIQIGPEENHVRCPRCKHGDQSADALANCVICQGKGIVQSVPYADRPWDEVSSGLWVGGHFTAGGPLDGTDCRLDNDSPFDVVVSLVEMPRRSSHWKTNTHWKPDTRHHLTYFFDDADLDPEHHTDLDGVADFIASRIVLGDKVLVRCQAGINRSALVAGLAMVKMGYDPDKTVDHMREVRSPFVLFNESFTDYLKEVATR